MMIRGPSHVDGVARLLGIPQLAKREVIRLVSTRLGNDDAAGIEDKDAVAIRALPVP
jgi:hypothetical protein